MSPLKALFAAAGFMFAGSGLASATELSSTVQVPETHQVLGWYGSLSDNKDWTRDFSVCFDPWSYGAVGCFANLPDEKSVADSRLIFDATVGYAFSGGFRLEGELSRYDARANISSAVSREPGQPQQLSVMVNGMYDFNTQIPLKPFIGAGLGGVRVHAEDVLPDSELDFSADESVWKLGVQGFAGLQYQFSPSLNVGLRYTHKIVSGAGGASSFDGGSELTTADETDLRSRALMLTLTYEFGAQ